MAYDAAQHFNDDTVKQLLEQARSALQASNASSALQVSRDVLLRPGKGLS